MTVAPDLPSSWVACSLGDVIDYGRTEKAEPDEIPGTAWLLELEDIESGSSRVIQRVTFAERRSRSTKNRFKAGDVLYGKLRPYLNKVVRATESGFCTTEIVPLRPPAEVNGGFLFYWLKHPQFRDYVESVSHGLNMPRLGTEAANAAPFVLAPLEEQRRIAEKLDALVERLEGCRERLERVPGILKRFRQSVLDAATSGELTRDWRDDQDLAMNWTVQRAGDVCAKVQSGGTPKAGFVDSPGVPFLKVYNIVNQRVAFDYRPQFVKLPVHQGPLAKSRAKPGDVIMNIVGPPLGKVAVIPSDYEEWNINQAITLFRPSDRISSGWLYIVLCSGANVRAIAHETKGSAGQSNISLSQCRDFEFPVPSVEEQEELVRRVNVLFELASRLEAQLASATQMVGSLVPASLRKAFRGELVPHDPNDEPASKLLSRIKAESVSAPKADKPQRSGKGRKRAPAKTTRTRRVK